MYKEVLRSIEGIGIFPSISLVIFFGFFTWLVICLLRKGNSHWEDAARLPLETDEEIETQYQKGS
ncbi:cbb3-type cytochrome c oxidase subunit 3 [Halalkalibaculum sp. DA3122]|uniref:cbb3-type cytochrome c oxidase subunit 3 n=1 Tax=unclassified Halalkalibaculum TaxID=2964617 RepID=UPI003753EE58